MIGAVLVAWVLVAALLLVLPALAWWIGGRAGWNRLSRTAEPDRHQELVRRHGLRPVEAAEVEKAVTWGRELQDPRLRAAVVDWVQSSRPALQPGRRRRPRWQLAFAVLGLLAISTGACALAYRLGGWGGLLFAIVMLGGGEVADWVIGRGPAQALRRNGGPAPS